MKPSDFHSHPYDSVLKNNESETVARNIMVILTRLGDTWQELPWDTYVEHRQKDGNFSIKERAYFDKVVNYTISPDAAKRFSPTWRLLCN
jgi:hypothetical protein